jgi:dTDP-4-amino-4,6-dideoxygalactose transaminase
VPQIALEPNRAGRHALHLYTIWLDWDELGIDRATLTDRLRALGIGSGWHFKAVHLHSFYRERYGYEEGMFPIAERISAQTLSLPLSPWLTDAQVERVIEAVLSAVGGS